ncbi:MAG TPA: hypothetical protein VHR66_21410 [Gemmataceae bacterium]|jgi:hypothetical protein|nr:hypothetical protein [Gemmataceae bacterium]
MTVTDASPSDLHEPPVSAQRVLIVGLIGVGLAGVAMMLGLLLGAPRRGFDVHYADGPRALLACVGLFISGCAVSMRPGWFGGWLCAAGAALLGYGVGWPRPAGTEWYLAPPRDWIAGVPNSWDSVQIYFFVAIFIGLIGTAWTLSLQYLPELFKNVVGPKWTHVPRQMMFAVVMLGMAYHFAGILSAVTSPPPTPYLTDHYWKRVARPYLQFAYMNNAYQFYSPDPGPACEIWICVEYRKQTTSADQVAEKECVWEYIPKRAQHYKDPLGLAFYRRLSLTENIAQYLAPGYIPLPAEQAKVYARRDRARVPESIDRTAGADEKLIVIPRSSRDDLERRVPNDLVVRQVLPSYAHHIAESYARPGWDVRSVKIYRALHVICSMSEFHGWDTVSGTTKAGKDPYNASYYLAYFQGEFDKNGRLVDPTDPMLYWLVPIIQDKEDWKDRDEYYERGGFHHYFTDYVSRHARCNRPVD